MAKVENVCLAIAVDVEKVLMLFLVAMLGVIAWQSLHTDHAVLAKLIVAILVVGALIVFKGVPVK